MRTQFRVIALALLAVLSLPRADAGDKMRVEVAETSAMVTLGQAVFIRCCLSRECSPGQCVSDRMQTVGDRIPGYVFYAEVYNSFRVHVAELDLAFVAPVSAGFFFSTTSDHRNTSDFKVPDWLAIGETIIVQQSAPDVRRSFTLAR